MAPAKGAAERDDSFFALLREVVRFWLGGFSRFAFGLGALGGLALAGFFGAGRAPRFACFLE